MSCEEIDFLNGCAQRHGAAGSRIMGGGFGGCTINLVAEAACAGFSAKTSADYARKFGVTPKVYEVNIEDGARKVD